MAEEIIVNIHGVVTSQQDAVDEIVRELNRAALAKTGRPLDVKATERAINGYLRIGRDGVYEASIDTECRPRWARIAAPVVATIGLAFAGALIIIAVAFSALREWLIWFR